MFLDGRASDPDRLRAHLRGCPSCRDILAVASTTHGELGDSPSVDAPVESPGRYDLKRVVGRGGQAIVWAAYDASLGREVAFKELRVSAEAELSAAARASFLRSAQITARLSHPAILSIHDFGLRSTGAAFYTMPLVDGETLATSIVARTRLASRLELLPHVIDVCNAIAFAHSRGIVHRDINPANVMVGRFGETALIDWGLAGATRPPTDEHSTSEDSSAQTSEGRVTGTPAYMSPEQAKAEPSDARTDVWGIGGLLFALATGHAPYVETDAHHAIARARAGERPRIPSTLGVSPELVAIIGVALAPAPGDRYPTASALGADLRALLAGREVSAYPYSPARKLARFVARHRVLVVASALTFVSMIAALGVSSAAYEDERAASEGWREAAERADHAEQVALAERDTSLLNLAIAHDSSATRLQADGLMLESALHALAALRSLARLGEGPSSQPSIETRAISTIAHAQVRPLRHVQWRVPNVKDPAVRGVPAAASPDTGELAVAGEAGVVRVLAAQSGRERRRIELESGSVQALAWLPDASLAIASSTAVEIYDARGAQLRRLPMPAQGRRWLLLTPDADALLIVHQSGEVERLSLDPFAEPAPLGVVAPRLEGATLLSDGHTLLVSTRDPELLVWDAQSQRITKRLELVRPAQVFEVSADGTQVLVGAGGWLYRVDLGSGEAFPFHQPYPKGIAALAWLDPSTAIVVGGSGLVNVLNTRSGASQFKTQHESVIVHASVIVDGDRVSVFGTEVATQWRFDPAWKGEVSFPIAAFTPNSQVVTSSCVADGREYVVGTRDGVWVLGPPGSARGRHLSTEGQAVVSAERGAGGEVVAAAGDAVRVWNEDGSLVRQHELAGRAWSARFSGDGQRYAALEQPDSLIVWDTETGAELGRVSLDTPKSRIALSPDGSEIAVLGRQGPIDVFDLASGTRLARLSSGGGWSNLEYIGAERLIAAGDTGVIVWSTHDEAPPELLYEEGDYYLRLTSSEGGALVVADGVSRAVLINMDTRKVFPLEGRQAYCLLADGQLLVLDEERNLRHRSTTFASQPFDPRHHREDIERSLAAHMDGFEIVREVEDP